MTTLDRRQKVLICLIIGLFLMFIPLYRWQNSIAGVTIGDTFLKRQQQSQGLLYRGSYQGEKISVQVKEHSGDTLVTLILPDNTTRHWQVRLGNPDADGFSSVEIRQNEKEIFRGSRMENSIFLYDQNKEPYLDWNSVVYNGYEVNWEDFELSLWQVTEFAAGRADAHRGNWAIYWMAVLCGVFLLIDICFPLAFFHWHTWLSVKNPEPSEFYIAMQHFTWYVLPVGLLIALLIGLFSVV